MPILRKTMNGIVRFPKTDPQLLLISGTETFTTIINILHITYNQCFNLKRRFGENSASVRK
jgi:hypothetical protein